MISFDLFAHLFGIIMFLFGFTLEFIFICVYLIRVEETTFKVELNFWTLKSHKAAEN